MEIQNWWRYRIDEIVPFQYPRWPPWKSSNHIYSQNVTQTEPKLDGRHLGCYGDSELLNHSVPISKIAVLVAILKLFKQHQILDCLRQSDLIAKMTTMAQFNISWLLGPLLCYLTLQLHMDKRSHSIKQLLIANIDNEDPARLCAYACWSDP